MIPYYNFLKITLSAGWSDEDIHQQFRDYNLPVTRDEISKIRAKLQNQNEYRKMIAENQQRHLNHEEGYVNKIVVNEFSFQSDTTSMISEITRIKNLSELKGSKFTFITLLSMEHLRVPLENMLLLNNSPMLVYGFIKQQLIDDFFNPLSFAGQLHITDQDIRKYCYFFWNVLKSSQRDFSQYLKEKKELGFYNNHLDPLLEMDFRVITGIDQNNIIFRKNNKLIFKHLNNIIDYLNEDKIPLNRDIEIIKTHSPLLKESKITEDIFQEIFSYADHQEGLGLSDNTGVFAPGGFLAIPQYNLIRLLLYCGYQIKEIKFQLKRQHYNPIPDSYLQKILEECQAYPEGRKMIEENSKRLPDALKKNHLARIESISDETKIIEKSSKQPSSQQEFYNSKAIRDTFKFPEFYDAVIEDPTKFFSCYEPLNELLSLENEAYTDDVEILLLLGKDLERINKSWKKEVKSELTKDQVNVYKYYFWNITDFQYMYEEDFGLRLYNYLALDPSNRRYGQHQRLIKSSDATGLADNDEELEFYQSMVNSILQRIMLALETNEEVPKMLYEPLKILRKNISKCNSENDEDIKEETKVLVEGVAKRFLYHGLDKLPDPLGEDDIYHPVQDEPYLLHRDDLTAFVEKSY